MYIGFLQLVEFCYIGTRKWLKVHPHAVMLDSLVIIAVLGLHLCSALFSALFSKRGSRKKRKRELEKKGEQEKKGELETLSRNDILCRGQTLFCSFYPKVIIEARPGAPFH